MTLRLRRNQRVERADNLALSVGLRQKHGTGRQVVNQCVMGRGRNDMDGPPTVPDRLRQSAADALARIAEPLEQTLILILSDINMPGMSGLEMLPKTQGDATRGPHHYDHRLRRSRNQAEGRRSRR